LELRILKDLGVNIIIGVGLRVPAKSKEPGWIVEILGLKMKKRQPDCRTPEYFLVHILACGYMESN
jgi:hypothetical protein